MISQLCLLASNENKWGANGDFYLLVLRERTQTWVSRPSEEILIASQTVVRFALRFHYNLSIWKTIVFMILLFILAAYQQLFQLFLCLRLLSYTSGFWHYRLIHAKGFISITMSWSHQMGTFKSCFLLLLFSSIHPPASPSPLFLAWPHLSGIHSFMLPPLGSYQPDMALFIYLPINWLNWDKYVWFQVCVFPCAWYFRGVLFWCVNLIWRHLQTEQLCKHFYILFFFAQR